MDRAGADDVYFPVDPHRRYEEPATGDNMVDDSRLVPDARLAPYRRRRTLAYVAAAVAVAAVIGIGIAAYATSTKGSDRSGDLPPAPSSSSAAPSSPCDGPPLRNMTATLLSTTVNSTLYPYPVESRAYPARWPGLFFVSQRHGGGVVVLDTRGPGKETAPEVIAHWRPRSPPSSSSASAAVNVSLEGQDMHGDVLVVCAIGQHGGLYVLNASDPARLTEIAFLSNLTSPDGGAGPLHVKLYVPTAHPDRLFAILSMGWVDTWPSNASTNFLLAVDVTDPTRPRQIASIATAVRCMESVLIVGDAAYVGGFCSTTFAAVNLGGLVNIPMPQMSLGAAVTSPAYVEMVSDLVELPPGCAEAYGRRGPVIVSALWTSPGGIATFNGSAPASETASGPTNATVVAIARTVSPEGSFANRVDYHRGTGLVLTPLEHGPSSPADRDGGFALYDVRNPAAPRLLLSQRLTTDASTRTYCAAFSPSGGIVYVWGVDDHSLRVYRLLVSATG